MSKIADALFEQALHLRDEERAELAAKLLESIDDKSDEDWISNWDAEILKRMEEVESGKVKTIPWSEAREIIAGRRHGPSA